MSAFYTNIPRMGEAAERLKNNARELEQLYDELKQLIDEIKRDSSVGKYMQGADACIATLGDLQAKTNRYAQSLEIITKLYLDAENRISNKVAEQANQAGLDINDGNASRYANRNYEDWGVSGDSINTIEYAYLARFCNDASGESNTAAMEEKFKQLIMQYMPENHPLRNMKIKAYK